MLIVFFFIIIFSEAHNYFVEYISKAYQALTDPISRENFEKYGHPDGRQVIYLYLFIFVK
jgi:preprotein translocase subunit Sec63